MRFTKSQTLKNQLTETVALWGICFFLLLGVGFYAFFQDIETFLTDREAQQQIDAQAAELATLLHADPDADLQAELQAYTHSPTISAVALIDAGGIRKVATDSSLQTLADARGAAGYLRLQNAVAIDPALHLYTRKLYGFPYTLALIMDSSSIAEALTMTTEFTLLLMMLLLLISIKALHYVLGRRLVNPVNRLRSAMESSPPADFADSMPQEISQAMNLFEQLQQSHDVMKIQFLKLMDALPGCFWWSDDGRHYAGLSDNAGPLLRSDAETLMLQPLWAWLASPAQARINRQRLQQAIDKQESSVDFAYQLQQDGKTCWFGETVTLSYDASGRLETVFGIINDISNRKERQKQQAEHLELAQRMKATATLVSGIAHEFKYFGYIRASFCR